MKLNGIFYAKRYLPAVPVGEIVYRQDSISPTFCKKLFCTAESFATFLYLQFVFVFFVERI